MTTDTESVTQPLLKTARLTDPFVAAGDRAYLIGTQDGRFPHFGEHVPGEMAGLWAHPQKLLDGLWHAVAAVDSAPADRAWLPTAERFEAHPWGVRQWFDLPDAQLRVTRTIVVPDGQPALLVDLSIEERGGQARDLEVAVLWGVDLRPGWLDPRPDGRDQMSLSPDGAAALGSDPTGPWWVACGSLMPPIATEVNGVPLPDPAPHDATTTLQRYRLALPAGGRVTLRSGVYGGMEGAAACLDGLTALLRDADALIAAKRQRLATALSGPQLDLPDETLALAWTWARCAYDWLIREVPGVGRGLGAGLPEFPWWFACDNAYALRGLLPLGDAATAVSTLDLLATISRQHNGESGRIIHELSCTGVVFNPGNTQETPQYAVAVLEAYLWSGDRSFLERSYPLCRDGVLGWTLGACDDDGDGLPEGYGIIEIEGLNATLIDSAAWTHEGLRAVGRMATILGDAPTATRCDALARSLGAVIEERFWREEEGLYGDLIATPRQLAERLPLWRRALLHQAGYRHEAIAAYLTLLEEHAAALPPDQPQLWQLDNWVINAPLEIGLSSHARATRVLDRLGGPEFVGPDGVYLSGLVRGIAMSISTGALAAAYSAYGRIDDAVALAHTLATTLTLRTPGAISELSPDSGCFVQAWSGYGIVQPLIAGVFGVFPDVAARHLVLVPQLPQDWPHARLHRLRLGGALVDITIEHWSGEDGVGVTCTVQIDEAGWRVTYLSPTTRATLPALTLLSVHAAPNEAGWGLLPELLTAGETVALGTDGRAQWHTALPTLG